MPDEDRTHPNLRQFLSRAIALPVSDRYLHAPKPVGSVEDNAIERPPRR